jgi:hypothetical protein
MIRIAWIFVFLWMCLPVFAQGSASKVSRGLKATSCEANTLNLDLIADKFAKSRFKDEFVILISRLGKYERSSGDIHARRLYTITSYLASRTDHKLQTITATGDRTNELGRVEIYVRGKLFAVFSAARCADIPVAICDDKDADPNYYLNGNFRGKCTDGKN